MDINKIIDEFIKDSDNPPLKDAQARGKRIKENFYIILRQIGIVTTSVEEIDEMLITTGDGDKFLSNDGTYKEITSTSNIFNIDGGNPSSVYLSTQVIDGGDPNSVYLPTQIIDGGEVTWLP